VFDLPEWVILVTLFTELLSPITYWALKLTC
jgi:hypothetical protein